jgi:hypothetical protein
VIGLAERYRAWAGPASEALLIASYAAVVTLTVTLILIASHDTPAALLR